MNLRDLIYLVLLGALWGGSFLFMRIAAPEFGPVPLIELRVAIAALFLVPLLAKSGGFAELRLEWKRIFILGLLNSAVPFCLLSFAVLSLSAGFAAIVNASAPLWGGLIAVVWLGNRLNMVRVLGLLVGFAGVVILVWNEVNLDMGGSIYAVPAALLAAFSYGFAANYAKKRLEHVGSVVVAAGSLIGAAIFLLPGAVWLWPDNPVSLTAWASLIFMAVASTALANVLYFRLIASSGPTTAISVAYLIPIFAVIFGVVFIDEVLTPNMLAGGVIILLGTALVTNMIRIKRNSTTG
jgi:drug/metabolite transporter (DMT)-like permease